MLEMIESVSTLKVTEIVCNTNLMEYTDKDVVAKGVGIITEVAEELNLIFDKYLVLDKFEDIVPDNLGNKKRVILSYFLNKPWEQKFIYKGI